MCELILFITQYYAWFNSTCYHPPLPGPTPGDLHFFFSLGSLFPTPGHTERDDSPTNTLFCVQNLNDDIDFRTIAKPDVLTKT